MSFTGFASTAQMIFVTPHSRFVAFESPCGQEEKKRKTWHLKILEKEIPISVGIIVQKSMLVFSDDFLGGE